MHANTRLTVHSRKKLVDDYLARKPVRALAQQLGVSPKTCYVWIRRGLTEGVAGLCNRSSRPHHIRCRLSAVQEAELLTLRRERSWGPLRLATHLRIPVAITYRFLRGHGQHRLPRPARPPVVRYEASAPGALVHLDVLHLFALRGKKPVLQFTVVDDYTRQAYALLTPKRTAQAALQALQEAQQAFGYPFQAVLTDNDVTFTMAARPDWWRDRWRLTQPPPTQFTTGCRAMGIRHRLTRIRRPQTNGKVERFHRTIREECWRPRLFTSEEERAAALPAYLHGYNYQRPHMGIGGLTPVARRDEYFRTHEVLPTS
jgi:transposase InsO family protein